MMPLRWQDIVDVTLLTFVIGRLYLWVRGTIAVQVALGMVTVGVGAWLASRLGLILTSAVLSTAGAVAILVVVVIFRDEIRRGLSRASPLTWWGDSVPGRPSGAASIRLSQTVFALAARKVGILLVLPRHDDLAEHLTGATRLDAQLTPALMEAIFTSTSPLHDGAAVIVGQRIAEAGAVLPLSGAPLPATRGTRHRAALGLAEVTDAVVICVSEERGEVSIAADGELATISSPAELRARLGVMFESPRRRTLPDVHASPPGRANKVAKARTAVDPRVSRQTLKDVAAHFVIFLGVAAAWGVIVFDDPAQDVARTVPLEIRGLRDNLAFETPPEVTAIVEVRTSRRRLQALPPEAITAYVDLSRASPGRHEFPVAAAVPAGIRVASVIPPVLDVEVLERRWLAVEVRRSAGLPAGVQIANLNPSRVQVVGRSASFDGVTALFTGRVREPFPSSGRLVVDLEIPDGLRLVDAKQAQVVITLRAATTADAGGQTSPPGR